MPNLVPRRTIWLACLKEDHAFAQPLYRAVEPFVLRSANAAWLDLPKQLLAIQRHRGSKGVGPGESDQGHDEVAIGFIQLLAAVLKHAI